MFEESSDDRLPTQTSLAITISIRGYSSKLKKIVKKGVPFGKYYEISKEECAVLPLEIKGFWISTLSKGKASILRTTRGTPKPESPTIKKVSKH